MSGSGVSQSNLTRVSGARLSAEIGAAFLPSRRVAIRDARHAGGGPRAGPGTRQAGRYPAVTPSRGVRASGDPAKSRRPDSHDSQRGRYRHQDSLGVATWRWSTAI